MALLAHVYDGRVAMVEPEFLIGRSPSADLQLETPFVSSQHASVRWNGGGWEIRDLGSRNGTLLDSVRLVPGKPYTIGQGSRLVFGNEGETWTLRDRAAPQLMAVPLSGGEAVVAEHSVLALPSAESPQATVFCGSDGRWVFESADGEVRDVGHRTIVEVGAARYRLSCPTVSASTSTTEYRNGHDDVTLEFSVSSDEEYVALRAYDGGRLIELGCRAHNYLLLTLARQRLADRATGHPEAACGWAYHDELTAKLGIAPGQFNIDVFRIRQHFARAGLQAPIDPVERRPRSKQVRIGLSGLRIRRE